MKLNLIIPAAGSGSRFKKGSLPKQFLKVQGLEVVYHSLLAFRNLKSLSRIIVATSKEYFSFFAPATVKALGLPEVKVVVGGKERADSIWNALKHVEKDATLVLIHDAARPWVHEADIRRVVAKAAATGAAILSRPVVPTMKRAGKDGKIETTVDRNFLQAAETPQVFQKEILLQANRQYSGDRKKITDDAFLVEMLGKPVYCVAAHYPNPKITYAEDLDEMKETIDFSGLRVGNGYDIHRLVVGNPLIIGGVKIPSERGVLAHSDGDVLVHAIIDALLGAASNKDIGEFFPDNKKQFRKISSLILLKRVKEILDKGRFEILNIDTTVVCEKPKLLPYKSEMKQNIAAALGIEVGQVSVKAKTNEGLDSQGHGFSLSVFASALLIRKEKQAPEKGRQKSK